MGYNNEKQVGDIAAGRLESAIRARTGGFKEHIQGQNKASLRDATAVSRAKMYKSVNGDKTYYLRAISIKMEKHGFIQNFGVNNTMRAGGFRNRTKPNNIKYYYRPHYFGMGSTPFLNKAISASGVVSFVSEEVARFRSEEIVINFSKIFEDL